MILGVRKQEHSRKTKHRKIWLNLLCQQLLKNKEINLNSGELKSVKSVFDKKITAIKKLTLQEGFELQEKKQLMRKILGITIKNFNLLEEAIALIKKYPNKTSGWISSADAGATLTREKRKVIKLGEKIQKARIRENAREKLSLEKLYSLKRKSLNKIKI